jgi:hypothetical protein
MKFAAQTSAGPLELELSKVGDGLLARLEPTGDSWNSTYTPVPLSSFLAEFARLPDAEAEQIAERVLGDWQASPASKAPTMRTQAPRAVAAFGPALLLVFLTVLAFGVIAYAVLRFLLGVS